MEQTEDKLYCPHCGSSQLVANKKGFGTGKAVTGAILTGGIGLLAGFIGSGNVKVTCLKCGKQWNPGELLTSPLTKEEKEKNYWCPVKLFCVPKIKVGFLAWNPTFFVTFVFVTKPK